MLYLLFLLTFIFVAVIPPVAPDNITITIIIILIGLIEPSAIFTAMKEITATNNEAVQPLIKPLFLCLIVAKKPDVNPDNIRQTANIGK